MLTFGDNTVTIAVIVPDTATTQELQKITSNISREVRTLYGAQAKCKCTFTYRAGGKWPARYHIPKPSEQEQAENVPQLTPPPTGIGGSFANRLSVC